MRHAKIFLAAFAFMLTTSTFANFDPGVKGELDPLSFEIGKILHGSDFISDDSFTAHVIFKVTEDYRIAIQQVNSPNKIVNEFLVKRLENRQLNSSSWELDKVYTLPVKVHSRK